METPPAVLLLVPFALIYYLVALRWPAQADKQAAGDLYGFARAARVYFLVYVLIPAVLGGHYLGLKWAALLPLAILAQHAVFLVLLAAAGGKRMSYALLFRLVFFDLSFAWAWASFGLRTGALVTLTSSCLHALYFGVHYSLPARK
jgi:hypothetical protein